MGRFANKDLMKTPWRMGDEVMLEWSEPNFSSITGDRRMRALQGRARSWVHYRKGVTIDDVNTQWLYVRTLDDDAIWHEVQRGWIKEIKPLTTFYTHNPDSFDEAPYGG